MFPATMNELNDESREIQPSDEDWTAQHRQLLREFPSLAAAAATYEGPVSGLFRATDLARFPTRVRPAFQVLGRAFWCQVRALLIEVVGELRDRPAPLAETLQAAFEELRLAEDQLESAARAHESAGRDEPDPELEAEARHAIKMLRGWLRRYENFASGRQRAQEVRGAR
jgi:hypothetical protein